MVVFAILVMLLPASMLFIVLVELLWEKMVVMKSKQQVNSNIIINWFIKILKICDKNHNNLANQ